MIMRGRRLRVLGEEGRVDRLRPSRLVVWGMGSGVESGVIGGSLVSAGLLIGVSPYPAPRVCVFLSRTNL